ncbi:protein of unknown function [Streptomyces murinus]
MRSVRRYTMAGAGPSVSLPGRTSEPGNPRGVWGGPRGTALRRSGVSRPPPLAPDFDGPHTYFRPEY